MNNENEIERMAKIVEPFITVLCEKDTIAEALSEQGIGDKKQAVKEFAATLKERACAVMNSTFDRRLVVDIKQIDNLITELYGADE